MVYGPLECKRKALHTAQGFFCFSISIIPGCDERIDINLPFVFSGLGDLGLDTDFVAAKCRTKGQNATCNELGCAPEWPAVDVLLNLLF
jgi:hypothetical protein